VARVKSIGDRAEAHEARIEAKRLRYLLEPLGDCIDGVEDIVTQLSELQDVLGALHDAQLFGSEIARHVAEVLASTNGNTPAANRHANSERDRAEGLLALSRRLRRDEQSAFAHVESEWLIDSALPLWNEVEGVAVRLKAMAKEGREVERKYLLTALPADVRPVEVIEVDQGYLPGERLVERVRRVRAPDHAEYYRTVKVGHGLDRMELEEPTTEQVFHALWPLTKGRRVLKRRHRIEDDGRKWEIDEFLDRALIVAEVEIEDPGDTVAIPEWLESIVDRDVTDEDEYSNQNLAR
jgi:CYTH domain-containing protein